MTVTKFFIGRAIVVSILLVLGFGVFVYKTYFTTPPNAETPVQETVGTTEPPVFVWKYEKANTLNLDGIPKTNVFLEATYSNGVVERTLIATTDGGCNDLPESDKDSVPTSTDAQCYAAGLGYHFKVTKGSTSYLVQKKRFEEASPDYTPPASVYEVVGEFPLSK